MIYYLLFLPFICFICAYIFYMFKYEYLAKKYLWVNKYKNELNSSKIWNVIKLILYPSLSLTWKNESNLTELEQTELNYIKSIGKKSTISLIGIILSILFVWLITFIFPI